MSKHNYDESIIIASMINGDGLSIKEVADQMGIQQQSLSNKLFRNSFSFSDFLEIAKICKCEIKIKHSRKKHILL